MTKMIDGNKITGKYFPIKTDTSCRLKWSWSTLYLNSGTTGSCHKASLSKIDETNFDSFHNTPKKIQARKIMLDGEWPGDGCQSCRDVEIFGGTSDRTFQLLVPDVYPKELDQDNSLVEVNPSILEVFFSNICNFKCVYCNSTLSSSIQAEEKKFGFPAIPLVLENDTIHDTNQYKKLIPLFWQWLEKNSNVLQRLHVMGGEPFLQKDFFDLIDFFESNPNPNLEFTIVTNLHIPREQLDKKINQLTRLLDNGNIKRADILASVDCWGASQEYVRNGFDCKIFEDNLRYLMSFNKFRLALNSTVCSLTLHEMPNLAEKFLEWNKEHEIFWYMCIVIPFESSPFQTTIFDYEIFEPQIKKMLSLLPTSNWDQQKTLETFLGIVHQIQGSGSTNQDKQRKLIEYLEECDRRRGTNWKNAFPWLKEIQDNVV